MIFCQKGALAEFVQRGVVKVGSQRFQRAKDSPFSKCAPLSDRCRKATDYPAVHKAPYRHSGYNNVGYALYTVYG